MENDQFQYYGLGSFAIERQKCPDVISGSGNPPQYFEILENARSDAPADSSGNTCFRTDWRIKSDADTITGSCYQYKYDYNSLRFEWNLKRVGKAPAG